MPLNELKNIDEAAYTFYAKKYAGREGLMKRRIPSLECVWNDVVFLSAIPPHDLLAAYASAGRTMHKRRFYRIDPAQLDHSHMAVWPCEDWGIGSALSCVPFDVADLERYKKVPERTIEYYRQLVADKRNGFPYAYVPHILYKGRIDIRQTEIVEV